MSPLAALVVAVAIVAIVLLGRWVWREAVIHACPYCHFPRYKCDCPDGPGCDHLACWPVRWTQDGWVEVCKVCGEPQYLGDDYDSGPRAS